MLMRKPTATPTAPSPQEQLDAASERLRAAEERLRAVRAELRALAAEDDAEDGDAGAAARRALRREDLAGELRALAEQQQTAEGELKALVALALDQWKHDTSAQRQRQREERDQDAARVQGAMSELLAALADAERRHADRERAAQVANARRATLVGRYSRLASDWPREVVAPAPTVSLREMLPHLRAFERREAARLLIAEGQGWAGR